MEIGPLSLGEYLASLAPGLELGTALWAIDPADLCGHDAVSFMHAQYRQKSAEDGRFLLSVSHVARCGRDGGQHAQRMASPDEWSAHEVKAALGLTRWAGDRLVGEAIAATVLLPEIGEAMLAGELDFPRARVLLDHTAHLADSVQAAVLANTLPLASLSGPRKTTGELADYASSLAMALDPHAKKDEYEAAVRGRKVLARRNPDGTADLTGQQLPPERVAAAAARIDMLAKAAKRDGDPRPIDQVRAEIFMCTTEGTWAGLGDAEILAALRACRPVPEGEAADASKPLDGIELSVSLYAALGLDLDPADLAGHGPLHTAHALTVLSKLGAAQWRWVLMDSTNHLIGTGLTPARPIGYAARSGDCSSVVNLHVHLGLLEACLRADAEGGIADFLEPEVWERWRTVLLDIAIRAAEPPPAPDDSEKRFAGARMRREVQLLHGRCIGVGCRAPARRSDLDHRHDHAKGGKTTPENSAPLCRRDHGGKHEGGWKLDRLEHGHRWTSRLGHRYDVPDRPVWRQLPEPVTTPANHGWTFESDPGLDSLGNSWEDSGLWAFTPPDVPPF
ncbi:MAG: DUF222 domain-containing protein [Sporichthyaceae bacterium]